MNKIFFERIKNTYEPYISKLPEGFHFEAVIDFESPHGSERIDLVCGDGEYFERICDWLRLQGWETVEGKGIFPAFHSESIEMYKGEESLNFIFSECPLFFIED